MKNHSHLVFLAILASLLIGCTPQYEPKDEQLTINGENIIWPASVEFDGVSWLITGKPDLMPEGAAAIYANNGRDDRLEFHKWPKGHEKVESFTLIAPDPSRDGWSAHGPGRITYSNKTYRTFTYKMGNMEGLLTHVDANGQIRQEGMIENSKRVGDHKFYAADGTVVSICRYEDDKPVSAKIRMPNGDMVDASELTPFE